MGDDTLKEILGIESEINERLDAETKKAAQWLKQAKLAIEQATQSEIAGLKAAAAQSEAAAKKAAADAAAETVRQAMSLAERIANLDEHRLRQIVWKHITGIVPRTKRDR